MNKIRHSEIYLAFMVLVLCLTACTMGFSGRDNDLVGTIEAQNTRIAVLSTQIAEHEQTNWSQWDAISYLSTQMPYALGWFTPIPDSVTVTPTPYIDIEYPPDARTGIAEVDRVIDTFLLSGMDARIELVHYIQYPCTSGDGLGGPPKCQADEADGTIVTAFPVLYSEGTHVRPEDIREVFDFSIQGLLAVYVVPENAYKSDDWPAGDYAIVFTSEDGGHPQAITLHITDGEIVRLEFNMGWAPFDQIWDRSDNFILPPSTRPRPTPQTAVCTPPACWSDEVHHCPGECPGGCGTTCATVTPPGQ